MLLGQHQPCNEIATSGAEGHQPASTGSPHRTQERENYHDKDHLPPLQPNWLV